jgi:hypothetical protein
MTWRQLPTPGIAVPLTEKFTKVVASRILEFSLNTNVPIFPRVTLSVLWMVTTGNCRSGGPYYKRGAWLSATMHGRDRATKHEHQAQGKKDFADHLCFHISYPMRVFC